MESPGRGCDHIPWNSQSFLFYLMGLSCKNNHVKIVTLRNRNKHYNTQSNTSNIKFERKKSNNTMQVCVGKRAYVFYPGIREMIIIHKRTCTI
jgi:hypothetical protein